MRIGYALFAGKVIDKMPYMNPERKNGNTITYIATVVAGIGLIAFVRQPDVQLWAQSVMKGIAEDPTAAVEALAAGGIAGYAITKFGGKKNR